MMCANLAFLRTPQVEQHGEHRVFPLTSDELAERGHARFLETFIFNEL